MNKLDDIKEMYEKSVARIEHIGLKPTLAVQYIDPVDGPLDAYIATDTPDHYAGEEPTSQKHAYRVAYTTNTAMLDAYHRLQLRLPGDPII